MTLQIREEKLSYSINRAGKIVYAYIKKSDTYLTPQKENNFNELTINI